MASSKTPLALFLALNLLMFSYSATAAATSCDLLSLGVCVDVLGNLLKIRIGPQPVEEPCCSVIDGLVALNVNAGVCICEALKLPDVLGLGGHIGALNINAALAVLLHQCGHQVPAGYVCGY